MAFVRSIGRLGLTALVVNTIIGSGIFGVPSELIRLVGRASPLAMIAGGLGMALIMACVVEVGSQFSQPGGAYLYTRTAFGRFVGMQVGWFSWIAAIAAAAANANLFVIYFSGFVPGADSGLGRALVLAVVVGFPVLANYVGVRSGTRLSTAFSAAKLVPLTALIVLGLWRFGTHAELISPKEITQPGMFAWGQALLLARVFLRRIRECTLPFRRGKRTTPHGSLLFSNRTVHLHWRLHADSVCHGGNVGYERHHPSSSCRGQRLTRARRNCFHLHSRYDLHLRFRLGYSAQCSSPHILAR